MSFLEMDISAAAVGHSRLTTPSWTLEVCRLAAPSFKDSFSLALMTKRLSVSFLFPLSNVVCPFDASMQVSGLCHFL